MAGAFRWAAKNFEIASFVCIPPAQGGQPDFGVPMPGGPPIMGLWVGHQPSAKTHISESRHGAPGTLPPRNVVS